MKSLKMHFRAVYFHLEMFQPCKKETQTVLHKDSSDRAVNTLFVRYKTIQLMLHSARAVSLWPFNTEAWFQSQTSPFESSGIQNGSQYRGFPLSVSFQQWSLLIFIHMLLLPEGQTGEAWEPSKK